MPLSRARDRGVPSEETLVTLFERQVDRFPSKLAIKSPEVALTYEELNRRANRIAHALLLLLGDEEEPVILFFPDSVESIAAMLGALKAGKMYVPLDPGVPQSRCATIARDAGARVVLTTRQYAGPGAALAGAGADLILTDELSPIVSDQNPNLGIEPERLASMYYTSGSTGEPKGVPHHHRARVANYRAYTDALSLTADDRFVLLYSCTFSGAVNNLFGSLLNGGILCPFDVTRHGVSSLAGWLERERITVYHSAPSVFRSLVEASENHSFADVRVVMLASDTIHEKDIEGFRSTFPRTCRFCNMWGVSESAFTRPYWVDWEQEVQSGMVPSIGPTEGFDEILLLDDEGAEVAPGETGEIVIRSENLSPGYWSKPEISRERFVPDLEYSHLRRYHTGDLGRRLVDGSVLHLGRNDFQVKVRGYRIELEEIEAVLRTLSGVAAVAVVASEVGEGEKRLVAHLTCNAGRPLSETYLRTRLAERLPDYMLPEGFVFHDALPVTAGGKIDRKALGAFPLHVGVSADRRSPRTELEQVLAGIWRKVLQIPSVGVDENFFDLGGNSLKALKLALAIEKRLQHRISPAVLIERPTIEQLASTIATADNFRGSLVPLQPHGSRPPLFCVHGSGGHVLFYRDLANALGPDQPVYGLQAVGLDGKEPPLTDVRAMAKRYVAEIRRVEPHGPYRLAGFCVGAYIAIEIASVLRSHGEEVDFLASFNADGEWRTGEGGFQLHEKRLAQLDWSGKLRYAGERVRYRWIWVRNRVGARLSMLEPLRFARFRAEAAHDIAVSTYRPSPFPGRVVLFQATENFYTDPAAFWNPIARGGVEVRQVPGGNETMFKPPHVATLARELRDCLDAARPVEFVAS